MAKTYTSIDSYVDSMGEYISKGAFGSEGSRIDPDSAMRNYIAEQIQRMEDNGRDVSGIQDFYDSVGSWSSKDFGNAWLFDGAAGKLGGKELTAIAGTMMRLDDMQSDGKITMEEYEGYINRMLCPDGIDAIKAGGSDDIFNMFEDIERDSARPANEDVRKDNEAALAIGTRPYINDRSDYLDAAREARAGDEAYSAKRNAEGYDVYSDMDDKLREARENGLLTEDQYADAKSGLRNLQRVGVAMPDGRDAVLFAMEDALASGDADLASKVMSQDGIAGIVSGSDEGIDILRSVAYSNAHLPDGRDPSYGSDLGHAVPATSDLPGVHDGNIIQDPEPMPVAGFDDLPSADVGARELADVMDAMGASYFEKSEAEGGISLEQYSAMAEAYDGMENEAQKQAYLTLHPDFAAANEYMSKLDALEDGVMSGRIYINVTTDENGCSTYGISYPDDRTEQPASVVDLSGVKIQQPVSERDPSLAIWYNPEIEGMAKGAQRGAAIGGMPAVDTITLPPNDAERAKSEFGDDFLADLNDVVNKERDPDYEPDGPGVHDGGFGSEPEEPGKDGPDFDMDLSGVKIELLSQQSPEERMRELQCVANDIWDGKLGNGEERRAALEEMGYGEEDRAMIASMVNQGQEWCETAGVSDFDELFPDPSGISLADREAEFQAGRSEAAVAVMTYESPYEFLTAWEAANGTALTGEDMSVEQAAELYDRAAHVLDEQDASLHGADGLDQQALEEGRGNLMSYVSENPDAGFHAQAEEPAAEPEPTAEPDAPEAAGDEYTPGA